MLSVNSAAMCRIDVSGGWDSIALVPGSVPSALLDSLSALPPDLCLPDVEDSDWQQAGAASLPAALQFHMWPLMQSQGQTQQVGRQYNGCGKHAL